MRKFRSSSYFASGSGVSAPKELFEPIVSCVWSIPLEIYFQRWAGSNCVNHKFSGNYLGLGTTQLKTVLVFYSSRSFRITKSPLQRTPLYSNTACSNKFSLLSRVSSFGLFLPWSAPSATNSRTAKWDVEGAQKDEGRRPRVRDLTGLKLGFLNLEVETILELHIIASGHAINGNIFCNFK